MATETLHHAVADKIARDIVNGVRGAGEVFSLTELQQEHAISRTVAREVMRMLESVGFVRARRRVGLVILPETAWDVMDARVIAWRLGGRGRDAQLRSLAALRAAVEPMAAAAAAHAARPEQRGRLVVLAEKLTEYETAGDREAFFAADAAFHAALLAASDNEMFTALSNVFALAVPAETRPDDVPPRGCRATVGAHAATAVAVAQRDADAAARIMARLHDALRAELDAG